MGINDNSKEEKLLYIDKQDVKKDNRRTLIILLTVLVFLITNVLCYIFGLNFASGSYLSSNGLRSLSNDIGDYRKLMLVKNIIDKTYNGSYDVESLVDNAISGMVDSLGDPYTVYMNSDEFYDFSLRSKGNYVGIGIQVAPKNGKILVLSVFENSPAQRSDLRAGDYILSVSGESVNEDSIDRAISLIKGEEGTKVSLVIQREESILDVEISREKIDILPVEYEKVQDDILYIKINSFDENSYKGVSEALDNNTFKGIILDLRGNPGGLLNECVDIASTFIPEGEVIVSTDDKYGNKEFIKAKKGVAEEVPIVVLGDSGSASASEVLIGALRDHNRATFIGSKTFGKGLVQRVFELGDGSGLKVTVSKYYTPNGDYINKVGISPDIEVNYTQEEILKNREIANGDEDEMKRLDPQYQKALEVIKEKIQ